SYCSTSPPRSFCTSFTAAPELGSVSVTSKLAQAARSRPASSRAKVRMAPIERPAPSRPSYNSGLSFGDFGAGQEIVDRHAEAVERPADQVVLPDGEHEIDHLLGAVVLAQGRPGGVRHHGVLEQIVGGLQQCCLGRAPARGLRTFLDALDLRLADDAA